MSGAAWFFIGGAVGAWVEYLWIRLILDVWLKYGHRPPA